MRFYLVSVDEKIKKSVDVPDEIVVDKIKVTGKNTNKRKISDETKKRKKQKSRPLDQHGHNHNKQRRRSN